jgi:type II secretion system protein N
MAPRLPNLGPRARKLVHYLGFALLAVVSYVLAFQLAFPFARVKDKVADLLAEKYDVTIGDVEGGLVPGRIYFKAVTVRTRPSKADEVATTFYVEQLQVDLGLFALLRGTAAVKLDAKIGSGHIKGDIALAKDLTSIALVGDDLPGASLPVREALGLPMSGKIRFVFNLELPSDKARAGKVGPNWTKAEGNLELACPSGCVIGDGKSKLRLNVKNQRQQAMVEGGIDFGKLTIDSLLADVEIKNGKLAVTKFETKSGDGDLHIDFDMALNQDINQSQVTGCLRFRGSDGLLKREPRTHAAISTTGAPLGPDNLFHIKLDGPLRDIRRLGQVCSGAGSSDSPARPNLTITPEPVRPPAIPQPPPAAPPPNQPPLAPTTLPVQPPGIGPGTPPIQYIPPAPNAPSPPGEASGSEVPHPPGTAVPPSSPQPPPPATPGAPGAVEPQVPGPPNGSIVMPPAAPGAGN